MAWWLDIECSGACQAGAYDALEKWPALPQHGPAAVAWIVEHGCPDCGSLDVTADFMDDDDWT
jgi:hypothetical protein